MGRISVALQMWTVRDECAKNFVGTLGKAARIGCEGVEFAVESARISFEYFKSRGMV